MDVLHLTLAFGVELNQLLASRGACRFLEVRAEATKETIGPVRDTVRLISCLGTFGSVVLLVEVH